MPQPRSLKTLKHSMIDADLKGAQLAIAVGITQSRLSMILCGRAIANPEERRRISLVLGKSEKELFS